MHNVTSSRKHKCDLCKKEDANSVGFYHDKHTDFKFIMCVDCYFDVPGHIPGTQMIRYVARLIRGKDDKH